MALDPISAVTESVTGFVGKVIDKIWPDKTEAEKAKAALAQLDITSEVQLLMGQLQINMEEAKTGKIFIAGWRPFIGWVCGAGFAWAYVVGPFFTWISTLVGHPTPLPVISLTEMMPVLIGMLGLGAYRTVEKTKNAEGNR